MLLFQEIFMEVLPIQPVILIFQSHALHYNEFLPHLRQNVTPEIFLSSLHINRIINFIIIPIRVKHAITNIHSSPPPLDTIINAFELFPQEWSSSSRERDSSLVEELRSDFSVRVIGACSGIAE